MYSFYVSFYVSLYIFFIQDYFTLAKRLFIFFPFCIINMLSLVFDYRFKHRHLHNSIRPGRKHKHKRSGKKIFFSLHSGLCLCR